MLVEIKRSADDRNSVPSKVYVDGQFECHGMEPARTSPVHPGHPCIIAGTYDMVRTHSPHLGYVTPEIRNPPPGRSEIRWHVANFPKDILGCMAVGDGADTDVVSNSKIAFNKLMALLNQAWDKGEKITAVYTDPQ